MDLTDDSKELINFIESNLNFIELPNYDRVIGILHRFFTENYNDITENINYTKQNIDIDENKQTFTQVLTELGENIPQLFKNKLNIKHFLTKLKNLKKTKIYKWFGKSVGKRILYYIKQNYEDQLDIRFTNLIGDFTPIDVIYSVEENLHNVSEYRCNYKSNTFILTVVSESTDVDEDLIKRLLTKAFLLIELRGQEDTETKAKIWLTDCKKQINNNEFLGVREVNSGYSFALIGESFVFRKEELEKVFVHELIHNLHFDFRVYPKELKDEFYEIFSIPKDNKLLIGEAYVETWTCVINCILVSYLTDKDCNDLFQKELRFSIFQFSKVLNFFKFSCLDNCEQSFVNQKNTKFRQKSSIFSYYLVKCMLLFNFENFLELCLENNDNLMVFNEEKNFPKLHSIILQSLENPKFINNINTTIDFIEQNKQDSFEYKTLRMTVSELTY